MSTQYQVQEHIRSILLADAPLSAWLTQHFKASLTVLLGNRPYKQIKAGKFPVASVIFEPEDVLTHKRGEPAQLTEKYHVDLGIHFRKASLLDDEHLLRIGEFEVLAAQALLKDRRFNGLVMDVEVAERVGDGNANHPHHFFTLILRVWRTAEY